MDKKSIGKMFEALKVSYNKLIEELEKARLQSEVEVAYLVHSNKMALSFYGQLNKQLKEKVIENKGIYYEIIDDPIQYNFLDDGIDDDNDSFEDVFKHKFIYFLIGENWDLYKINQDLADQIDEILKEIEDLENAAINKKDEDTKLEIQQFFIDVETDMFRNQSRSHKDARDFYGTNLLEQAIVFCQQYQNKGRVELSENQEDVLRKVSTNSRYSNFAATYFGMDKDNQPEE